MPAGAAFSHDAVKVLFRRGKDLLSFYCAGSDGQEGRGGDLRNVQDPPDKSST
jgi:hypothetical protein